MKFLGFDDVHEYLFMPRDPKRTFVLSVLLFPDSDNCDNYCC